MAPDFTLANALLNRGGSDGGADEALATSSFPSKVFITDAAPVSDSTSRSRNSRSPLSAGNPHLDSGKPAGESAAPRPPHAHIPNTAFARRDGG